MPYVHNHDEKKTAVIPAPATPAASQRQNASLRTMTGM